ncbi:MAG: TetR/AcrR family transcriptional regulator [Devosia sp.]|uniref:TetR/AcrR family transcriptional regulator n=1 Tax=Devosia sp. TaxID=1871048 RepID=UPI00261E184E|nr:helix-turn-helix domain-containing protein [Devosia sp.]MDB5529307.1 TetR/AcrR family transcriptional regulator [Devosia sp.]
MNELADGKTQEKRRRILEAARFLVLRNGLRGTTMEAIAREAGIAKPTLYAQFADKDAIFVGIVDAMMDDLLAAYDSGMAGGGDISERVGAALAGQYAILARTLAGSPHAGELMSEHKRVGVRFREKDLRAEAEIAAALRAAGVGEPELLTRVICAAAYGVALKITDEAQMVAGIKLLCRRLIEPELH